MRSIDPANQRTSSWMSVQLYARPSSFYFQIVVCCWVLSAFWWLPSLPSFSNDDKSRMMTCCLYVLQRRILLSFHKGHTIRQDGLAHTCWMEVRVVKMCTWCVLLCVGVWKEKRESEWCVCGCVTSHVDVVTVYVWLLRVSNCCVLEWLLWFVWRTDWWYVRVTWRVWLYVTVVVVWLLTE
jgi:hypothetical protein